MDYRKLSETLYFALKIALWSEQVYESLFDQTGYSMLLEQA